MVIFCLKLIVGGLGTPSPSSFVLCFPIGTIVSNRPIVSQKCFLLNREAACGGKHPNNEEPPFGLWRGRNGGEKTKQNRRQARKVRNWCFKGFGLTICELPQTV